MSSGEVFYVTGSRISGPGGARPEGIARITEAFAAGVDFVQLRAKHLSGSELFQLASRAVQHGKLLVNDRVDIALATGAAGVHLPSHRPPVTEYRKIAPRGFIISVSCHSIEDVARAAAQGADYALLAPIFDTPGKGPALGLDALREASQCGIPVIALGGITLERAALCREVGAAGIAAIRLFEEADDLKEVIRLCKSPAGHGP